MERLQLFKNVCAMSNIKKDFPNILNDALENEKRARAVIRKRGNKWCVFSKTGRNLGCYPTRKQAEERLTQIEKFKHMDKR
jgi:hypothetical protein